MKKISTAGIIATRDQQDFIAESVLSLASQVDEVVVVNDGSMDNTAAILAKLEIPNFKTIDNMESVGVSKAFNMGALATSADFLFLQGGDDRSLPNRVNNQTRQLEGGNILVSSVPRVINALGEVISSEAASEFHKGLEVQNSLISLFVDGNYICAPSVALRKSDYEDAGGFKPGINLLQDYALWLNLAEKGAFYIDENPQIEYRKHQTNLSREFGPGDLAKRQRFSSEMEFVLTDFVTNVSPQTLAILCDNIQISREVQSQLSREIQIMAISLAHPNKHLVRFGLQILHKKVVLSKFGSELSLLDLSPSDLDFYASKADVDNLEALARSLNVSSILNEMR